MFRYIYSNVINDLKSKMVFIGGPRQVGKTTLSFSILGAGKEENPAYLNWDDKEDREKILNGMFPPDQNLIVLDEIHKYRLWRGLIKGFYDKKKSRHSFLVTGSARLDYYRRGGDSLQGRYHYYRLHPLSLGELISHSKETGEFNDNNSTLSALLRFGGFPEPFFKAEETHWRRWQNERMSRVIQEDLVSLEKVNEVSSLELLADSLPSKVASILSVKSLSEDLSVAHNTVKRWLQILENLYVCFRISPFGAPTIRAVKKEQKLYMWDWSLCIDEGARFENLVASQLLKYCHLIEDTQGFKMELRYIRDTDKREVDFIVIKDQSPLFAVECKLHDTNISPNLRYFRERMEVPAWFQVHLGDSHYEKSGIEVIPFEKLVRKLELP